MSIEVRGITKAFGPFAALQDITLSLETGKLTAILGPSGCGKTTLLRIIAGLEWADKGAVLLDGEYTSEKHVRDRQVGFVFQHYALFRHMTVFENVAFGLRVKPRKERPSKAHIGNRVRELLELVQLSWLADRYPAQLSGGQRQRIALARALAVEPRVLLLDEPFGALDAKVRKELRRWLRRLHDELHITSIFVTHDQDEAFEVADRVVLMNRGRVEQEGTAAEVYANPETAFASSFLGAENELSGRVEGQYLRVGDDLLPAADTPVANGALAVAYARPHELRILPNCSSGPGLAAKVSRIRPHGIVAQVELIGQKALNGSEELPHFRVEITRDELNTLALFAGQNVRLTLPTVRIFSHEGKK